MPIYSPSTFNYLTGVSLCMTVTFNAPVQPAYVQYILVLLFCISVQKQSEDLYKSKTI